VVSLKSTHAECHDIATLDAELCQSYTPSTTGTPMDAEHLEQVNTDHMMQYQTLINNCWLM